MCAHPLCVFNERGSRLPLVVFESESYALCESAALMMSWHRSTGQLSSSFSWSSRYIHIDRSTNFPSSFACSGMALYTTLCKSSDLGHALK